MEIFNRTHFNAAATLWEDLQGRAKLSVIVKCSFVIENGKAVASNEQVAVFTSDQHYRDDPEAPVRFESDAVPFKPSADIVLVGAAHAPNKRPVTQMDAVLRVGSLEKWIRVFGDRSWRFPSKLAGAPVFTSPEPFQTMELTYERAFGGIDQSSAAYCPENPVGRGFIGKRSPEAIHDKRLPNIEDPRHLIQSWDDHPKPVGFGFYGRGWMPRLRYAGTYDEKYQKEQAPALPKDFSYALFNGAHPELQVTGYLRGDEPVELVNLSPQGRLRFNLPGVRPQIRIRKWTVDPAEWMEKNTTEGHQATLDEVPASEESIDANLDTLVLTPDEGTFYEVFRGVCPLKSLDRLEVHRINVSAQNGLWDPNVRH